MAEVENSNNNNNPPKQTMGKWRASALMVNEMMTRAPWVEGRGELVNPLSKKNTLPFSQFIIK